MLSGPTTPFIANAVSSNIGSGTRCTFSIYTDSTCSGASLIHTIDSEAATCSCLFSPKPMTHFTAFCAPAGKKRSLGNATDIDVDADVDDEQLAASPHHHEVRPYSRITRGRSVLKRTGCDNTLGGLLLRAAEAYMMLSILNRNGVLNGGFTIQTTPAVFAVGDPLPPTNLFTILNDAPPLTFDLQDAARLHAVGGQLLALPIQGAVDVEGQPPSRSYTVTITTGNLFHPGAYDVQTWGNEVTDGVLELLIEQALTAMVQLDANGQTRRVAKFTMNMRGDSFATVTIQRDT